METICWISWRSAQLQLVILFILKYLSQNSSRDRISGGSFHRKRRSNLWLHRFYVPTAWRPMSLVDQSSTFAALPWTRKLILCLFLTLGCKLNNITMSAIWSLGILCSTRYYFTIIRSTCINTVYPSLQVPYRKVPSLAACCHAVVI